MRHSKKMMICLLVAAILTGCGQSGSAPATAKETEDMQTDTKTSELIFDMVGTYPLAVNGKFAYQNVLVNLETDEGKLETGEREYGFTGYPTDIKLSKNSSPGVVEIEAVIANDFFKTAEPVKIVYEYDFYKTSTPTKNNEYGVKKATIVDNGNLLVEPTQPFDFEMFYDENRRLSLNLQYHVEHTPENPVGLKNVEIPITKDNIEKIEYSYNIKYPGIRMPRTGIKSDFGYNGGILFTLKNGDKYVCSSYLRYWPYETSMRGKLTKNSQLWGIEIVSPEKIE